MDLDQVRWVASLAEGSHQPIHEAIQSCNQMIENLERRLPAIQIQLASVHAEKARLEALIPSVQSCVAWNCGLGANGVACSTGQGSNLRNNGDGLGNRDLGKNPP